MTPCSGAGQSSQDQELQHSNAAELVTWTGLQEHTKRNKPLSRSPYCLQVESETGAVTFESTRAEAIRMPASVALTHRFMKQVALRLQLGLPQIT